MPFGWTSSVGLANAVSWNAAMTIAIVTAGRAPGASSGKQVIPYCTHGPVGSTRRINGADGTTDTRPKPLLSRVSGAVGRGPVHRSSGFGLSGEFDPQFETDAYSYLVAFAQPCRRCLRLIC